jgi:hypothetical protein
MPSNLDDVYETRRENLSRLLKEPGAKTQLAARLGASQSHITHLLKPPNAASARAIREETARQIEQIMGLANGALDRASSGTDLVVSDGKGRVHLIEANDAALLEDSFRVVIEANDAALLEDSFRVVIEALSVRGLQIPPEKAAKMARLVYEQARATGAVDPALVSSLIGLMS